jgi:hypothetical protein
MMISLFQPDILTMKRKRLHALQRQAARTGHSTPPEVAIEIEDLVRELDPAGMVAEPLTEAERYAALAQWVGDMAILLHETRLDVKRLLYLSPIYMLLFVIVLAVLR